MREKSSPLGYYTIGIAALFLLGFLLLIIFGAGVYRDTVSTQDNNNQTRALRSYLITCSRAAAAGDVEVKTAAGIDGQILTIRDSGTDYGLQIFLDDGHLMESYSRLDAAPDPDKAQPIAVTASFSVEQISQTSYAVTTDAGRTLLHVGSSDGGTGGDTDDAAGRNMNDDAAANAGQSGAGEESAAEGGGLAR